MDHRIPPSQREVLPGITLSVSTMGGYSVLRGTEYLGWIHASAGNQWNAYLRHPGEPGVLLGKFTQDEAVRRIVSAAR